MNEGAQVTSYPSIDILAAVCACTASSPRACWEFECASLGADYHAGQDWVADLARREAACCPFVSHHVSFDAKSMFERLARRGVSIDTSIPGRMTLDEKRSSPGLLGRIKAACRC